MATETLRLLVDWDNDDTFGHAEADISADLLDQLSYFMGRDSASTLHGRSSAGQLTAKLDNSGHKFSRNNSSSVLTGLLLPNRRVRLQSETNGGGFTTQWDGYLDDIEADERPGGAHTASLVAFGPLSRVQAEQAYVAPTANILTGAAYTDVLDGVGFPSGDRVLDAGLTTMNRWGSPGHFGGDALLRLEETEAGFTRETRDNEIAFEDRHHRMQGAHLTSQTTFSNVVGASIFYSSIVEKTPLQNVVNIIRASVKRQTVASIATLWTLPESGADSPAIGPGDSIIFVAEYPTPNANTEDVGVSVWTPPVATTDYTANSQAGGGGTDMTGDVGIATLLSIDSMCIEVTNNHASLVMFLTMLAARGTALQAEHVVSVEHREGTIGSPDTGSILDYGRRRYTIPAEFLPDTVEAQSYCRYIGALHREPHSPYSIRFAANQSQAAMDAALVLDVSDRVTLVNSGVGINDDYFIERMFHEHIENVHWVELELSDIEASGGLVIVLDTGPGLDTGIIGY